MKIKTGSAFAAHQARTYRSIVEAVRTQGAFQSLRDADLNYEEALLELATALTISRSSLIRRLKTSNDLHTFIDGHLTTKRVFPFQKVQSMFAVLRRQGPLREEEE